MAARNVHREESPRIWYVYVRGAYGRRGYPGAGPMAACVLMDTQPPPSTLARNNCIVFLTMRARACVLTAGVDGFSQSIEGSLPPHDDVIPSLNRIRIIPVVKNIDDGVQARGHNCRINHHSSKK